MFTGVYNRGKHYKPFSSGHGFRKKGAVNGVGNHENNVQGNISCSKLRFKV